ncbi:MAG: hypothetical protein ACM3UR_12890 [Bacteroidota bacterium]|jgi:hypothetical protein|nr:hypothetical protein [Ignavibacteria bacterium]MCU7498196.1 hypothetical protein [Ignavibacteria bacterium]MCU7511426.1 hypothetical protein [Ignavibacteria bacterium]MCU7519399.1 hypothetical protein [Ignavibacteria bacterium]MCU7523359.1 hypothetical protein [Ignavibacteria bacterium]
MEKFDLALAYTWEYDEDFIRLIEDMARDLQITTYIVREDNVFDVIDKLKRRSLSILCYLDRASDVNDDFEEIAHILSRRNTKVFNPYKLVSHAIDKATMHLEFITAGLHTPYSIIIPPFSEEEEIYLSLDDLAILDRPFIIKPCNTTGGGMGVVTGAETLKEVLEERMTNNEDKYLLQEKIYPQMLDGRRAWFRSFWAFGKAIPCWWDDQTHYYSELTNDEVDKYHLQELFRDTRKIARLTSLDFFSTEIVLSTKGKFIVVDYVNDQCDMRFQSRHFDGVPDNVVRRIIYNMLMAVRKIKRTGQK